MIALQAGGFGLDGDVAKNYEIRYKVSASFEVLDEQHALYREAMFPVAELANELFRWLSARAPRGEAFSFDSVFSDETGLVTIDPTPDGRWIFGSRVDETRSNDPVDHPGAMAAVEDFVTQVDTWCVEHVGVSIRQTFRS